MKKVISILIAFFAIGILACFITALCIPVPPQIYKSSQFLYKLCSAAQYILIFFPGMMITAFIVGFSVQFGSSSEGSFMRFSPAMIKRYKSVMIVSIICTFFITLGNESLGVIAESKKNQILNRPKIVNEYIKVGNEFYNKGYFQRSVKYAQAALELDPKSKEANDLKNKASIEVSRESSQDLRFNPKTSEPVEEVKSEKPFDAEELSQSYEYYQKAKKAYDSEQWFDAHYYAELGLKLNARKDPNYENLRDISVNAWNNLTEVHKNTKTEEQQLFDEKYKGYIALAQGDDLQAYYIFKNLIETSSGKKDSDVKFYYEVAQKKVEEKYFFVDETFELKSFEKANDVYFVHQRQMGNKNIVYFKGMTEVQDSGSNVQYIRDLTILTFTGSGEWIKAMHVAYAKVIPVFVESLPAETKKLLEIDDKIECVPYILLKSVGREDPDVVYSPEYTYAKGQNGEDKDYIIFPMDFTDFILVENSGDDIKSTSILELIKISSKAKRFGYSQEIFGQAMLNRLLYPLFILMLLVLLASFAWNNRVSDGGYFKFSWFLAFPLFIITQMFLYQFYVWMFKLFNYVLIALIGGMGSLFVGIGIYFAALVVSSIYFLARNSSN
ncbi:MAG: hypothetical protein IKX23_10570 [Treponema sp.]|nr:hypothetical protein [Treponema sp.]